MFKLDENKDIIKGKSIRICLNQQQKQQQDATIQEQIKLEIQPILDIFKEKKSEVLIPQVINTNSSLIQERKSSVDAQSNSKTNLKPYAVYLGRQNDQEYIDFSLQDYALTSDDVELSRKIGISEDQLAWIIDSFEKLINTKKHYKKFILIGEERDPKQEAVYQDNFGEDMTCIVKIPMQSLGREKKYPEALIIQNQLLQDETKLTDEDSNTDQRPNFKLERNNKNKKQNTKKRKYGQFVSSTKKKKKKNNFSDQSSSSYGDFAESEDDFIDFEEDQEDEYYQKNIMDESDLIKDYEDEEIIQTMGDQSPQQAPINTETTKKRDKIFNLINKSHKKFKSNNQNEISTSSAITNDSQQIGQKTIQIRLNLNNNDFKQHDQKQINNNNNQKLNFKRYSINAAQNRSSSKPDKLDQQQNQDTNKIYQKSDQSLGLNWAQCKLDIFTQITAVLNQYTTPNKIAFYDLDNKDQLNPKLKEVCNNADNFSRIKTTFQNPVDIFEQEKRLRNMADESSEATTNDSNQDQAESIVLRQNRARQMTIKKIKPPQEEIKKPISNQELYNQLYKQRKLKLATIITTNTQNQTIRPQMIQQTTNLNSLPLINNDELLQMAEKMNNFDSIDVSDDEIIELPKDRYSQELEQLQQNTRKQFKQFKQRNLMREQQQTYLDSSIISKYYD
ncbi:UNKNOWN [Stylonychia lemnae]|uniref:Uncharacterized protein n=1 Tax=Stylonychia lemnae TaxID=5949 RepID=A0A078A2L3_STYLE|nr:UNKNOWN [Stylonychia lemnae]|eukprot:CDW76330.1 UNKNOWN [Stylonychia lemnae]